MGAANMKETNMTNTDGNIDATDLLETLKLTKVQRRTGAGGTWAKGTIGGHRFNALVFPEHAENPDYEPMVFTEGVEILGRVVAVLRTIR